MLKKWIIRQNVFKCYYREGYITANLYLKYVLEGGRYSNNNKPKSWENNAVEKYILSKLIEKISLSVELYVVVNMLVRSLSRRKFQRR